RVVRRRGPLAARAAPLDGRRAAPAPQRQPPHRGPGRRRPPGARPRRGAHRRGGAAHQGRPPPTDPRGALLRRPQGTARARRGGPPVTAVSPPSPAPAALPAKNKLNWSRMWVVARTDLRSLLLQRDFWLPMALLGSFF